MSPSSDETAERRAARILLVEDNPADVRLTREMLREAKVRNDLLVARNAEEASRILGLGEALSAADERPDLVLLDLNLPGKSGHELLEELKAHPELRRVPVVILTSSEAEEDIQRSYDRYANAYVTKPVDLEQIWKVVRAIDDFWFEVVQLPGDV